MTCASCAMRIEKRLNKIDGVAACVNYATEKANATAPATVSIRSLIEPSRQRATPRPTLPGTRDAVFGDLQPERRHRGRLKRCRAPADHPQLLSLPVIVLAMVPAWQFTYWQWLSLGLATPVVAWAGWPFHRAAGPNLRHRAATMDTLISVGTLAAYGWSLYALFFGHAGVPRDAARIFPPRLGSWR